MTLLESPSLICPHRNSESEEKIAELLKDEEDEDISEEGSSKIADKSSNPFFSAVSSYLIILRL